MASPNASCITGAEPVRLNNDGSCNEGFFCPNSNAENPPTFCAPTSECFVHRLSKLDNICPVPQGTTEPIICAPGYFCPPGGKTVLQCPAGYHCPLGSVKPLQCGRTSICRAGATREVVMDGFITIIVVDALLLFMMIKPIKSWYNMIRNVINAVLLKVSNSRLRTDNIETEETGGFQTPVTEDDFEMDKDSLSQFLNSVNRCVGTDKVGMSFGFKNICRTLENGKEIVASQTGYIQSGSLWGVMGGSGAGKTSFVNLIMGKTRQTSGITYVNEAPCNISRFKSLIGYVPQDDILMAELTVRENIRHSARIRLPSTWTDDEINAHIDNLIACLGLTHVQNNRVGDAIESYISGGQRKRVSIGVELVAAPLAVFLDEPTSGLDSTGALSIIRLLKTLSQLGITIICIIHQPRLEILETLDGIHLLGRGRQLYHGKFTDLAPYFETMGFHISKRSNVADAVLDIISDTSCILDQTGRRIDIEYMANNWSSRNIELFQEKQISETQDTFASLVESAAIRGATWPKQARLCFLRSMKQQWRQKKSFIFEICVGGAAGMLIGLSLYPAKGIHFQGIYKPPFQLLSSAVSYDLIPQMSLFCALSISLAAAAPGVKTFGEEKLIYWREASAGHSRSAYYIGKVLSTLPRISLSAIHYTTLFYVLATPLMGFWRTYFTNLIYFYCIYGLASIPSMLVRREDGPPIALILSLIIGVFNGYGPPLSVVKSWHLEWFWRTCPGIWYTEAFFDENVKPLDHLYDLDAAFLSIGYVKDRFTIDMVVLLVIGSAYRIAAYFGLILMNREKQR